MKKNVGVIIGIQKRINIFKDMTECKHDYSIGLWFCPYYDSDKENFIATCCQCGKIKYQRIRYTGRRKDGSRILRKI